MLLDEPTNHLDIPAAEILEEALTGFEGTVILVSHDRRFLETVTTRTMAFVNGSVDVYEGGFTDYSAMLERRARAAAESEKQAREKREREQKKAQKSESSAAERHRARLAAARELERKTKRVAELERLIAAGEGELAALRDKLREAPGSDWEVLHEWAMKERKLSESIDRLMNEWTQLSDELQRADRGSEARG
jgi:ATP-binding cassette subfamily F protein 3